MEVHLFGRGVKVQILHTERTDYNITSLSVASVVTQVFCEMLRCRREVTVDKVVERAHTSFTTELRITLVEG